jgi:hypothetical protein
MAHHRDAGARDRARTREHRSCALELDALRPRILDQAHGVAHRLLVGDLEGAQRQVDQEEGALGAAPRGAPEHDHLVHADRRGVGIAEHVVRRRIAGEHDVDARRIGQACARIVVGGDHHDLVAALLHLCEIGDRHRNALAHHVAASSSRRTLSINRV